jgi:hypothetical protein
LISAVQALEVLEASALSAGLRASEWLYPMVNALHIVGIALLVGPVLVLDWRVLRLRSSPNVSVLAATLLPTAHAGFALTVATGGLLFAARPLDYAFHTVFQVKLGFIALALLNIALLGRSGVWQHAMAHNQTSWRVRLACGISLCCWLMAIGLGRLIGYR